MSITAEGKIQGRYSQLSSLRDPFLTRARDCAKLTIPTLIPPAGASGSTRYSTPYQGVGARGVNNLASKLLLTLLPPNSPFFRLVIEEDKIRQQLMQNVQMKTEIDVALGKIERRVMLELEGNGSRVGLFEALKHLIVGGNVLLFLPEKGGVKVFHLDGYVCKRDPQGKVLEIITKESTVPQALSPKIRAIANLNDKEGADDASKKAFENTVDIYTKVQLSEDGESWIVDQEVNGFIIPDSHGTYKLDSTPWLPLRLISIDGEDYGRGYVEEYLGDLISLEALTKAIVQGSVAAARVLFLVRPNGSTKARVIAEAPNGEVVTGDANEVTALHLEKYNDFRVALECMKEITGRLSFAFLLNAAVQRQAERVTASEIMYMAGELEDALGGMYALLAQELQLPLVQRLMAVLTRQGKLPEIPKGLVKPLVITGVEALGRSHEMQKLQTFLQQIAPLGEQAVSRLNIGNYLSRCAVNVGMDITGLIKSEEEIAAERQQLMQQQMMQQAVPQMIGKGADYMRAANEMQQQQGGGGEAPASE